MTSSALGGAGAGRHRRRSLLIYLAIIAVGIVSLALVLRAGRGIRQPPQLPGLLSVNQAAARCLGERLAVEQSGVFVDLHVPGPFVTAAGEDRQLGTLVARGRLDDGSDAFVVNGRCPAGSELSGGPFTASLRVTRGSPMDAAVTGDLRAEGVAPTDISLDGADPSGAPVTGSAATLAAGDVLSRVLLAVAVLIIVARAVGTVFRFVRQPRVLGEIVAGILLGPSLLGTLLPDVTRYLFPPEVTSVLRVMAQFGLIFFMFLIGLGVDLGLVRKLGHAAVLISHVSIVVPFSLGVVAALTLYPLVGNGSFSGFALFMGAAMAITAFPVLARILTETGISRTPLGNLSIACAAVDDATAWCLLAVVVGVVKSAGAFHAVRAIVLTGLFTVLMLVVVRPALERIAEHSQRRAPFQVPVVAGLMASLLLAAWATDAIGTHAIFGAFMVGLVFPRTPGLVSEITGKLEYVTTVLFLPIFFAVVGLSTRIGDLVGATLWWLAALVIAVAVVGKWGGSTLAGRAAGLRWREANALGILMNTRGLTEIVILSVGRSLGVVSPALFTIMVLMALFTTFMTTPILSVAYPLRSRDGATTAIATTAPPRAATSDRLLVVVDGRAESSNVVALLQRLRGSDGRRPEVVLTRMAPPPGEHSLRTNLEEAEEAARSERAALAPLAFELLKSGIDARVRAAVGARPGDELARIAEEEHPDLVLVERRGRSSRRSRLSGIGGDLMADVGCDVAVFVDPPGLPIASDGDIVVLTGGGRNDSAAMDLAIRLTGGDRRSIVVCVVGSSAPPEPGADVRAVTVPDNDPDALVRSMVNATLVVCGRTDPADRADGMVPFDTAALAIAVPAPLLVVERGLGAAADRRLR